MKIGKKYTHFDFKINDKLVNVHFETRFLEDNRIDILNKAIETMIRESFARLNINDVAIKGKASFKDSKDVG